MMKHSFLFLALVLIAFFCSCRENDADARYGLINTKGEIVAPPVYDAIRMGWNKFYVVSRDNKMGMLDADGKPVGQIEFDDVCNYFLYPMYKVSKNGKTGFMNQHGEVTIPCIYDDFDDLKGLSGNNNDRYILKQHGKYGMVDGNHTILFPFVYSVIDNYGEGEDKEAYTYTTDFALCKEGKYALANKEGEVLTPFIYDHISLFPRGGGRAVLDGKYCFLSSSGREIVAAPGAYSYQASDIKDLHGLVAIGSDDGITQFYTYDGKKLDKEYRGSICQGFCGSGLTSMKTEGDTWIVIDTLANVIMDTYYPVNPRLGICFRNGTAIVRDHSGMMGVIDTKGNVLIPFRYQKLTYLSDGYDTPIPFFLVENENESGIFTAEGKLLTDDISAYDHFYDYKDMFVVEKDGRKGVLSLEGKEIIPCEYQSIDLLGDGMIGLEYAIREIGFYNIHTGDRLPCEFDGFRRYHSKGQRVWVVGKEGKEGAMNLQCELVLPCRYKSVEITPDGHFIVTNEEDVSAILDSDGNVVRPFGHEYLSTLWDDLLLLKSPAR